MTPDVEHGHHRWRPKYPLGEEMHLKCRIGGERIYAGEPGWREALAQWNRQLAEPGRAVRAVERATAAIRRILGATRRVV